MYTNLTPAAAGVKLVYMNEKDHAAWVEIAKKSSHKAFADKVPGGDKLIATWNFISKCLVR